MKKEIKKGKREMGQFKQALVEEIEQLIAETPMEKVIEVVNAVKQENGISSSGPESETKTSFLIPIIRGRLGWGSTEAPELEEFLRDCEMGAWGLCGMLQDITEWEPA